MRRTRAILTVLGVSVCIFLSVFVISITALVQRDVQNTLSGYVGQIYVKSPAISGWQGEEFPPLSSSIDEKTAESIISATSGINRERSSPILFVPLAPPPYPGAPASHRGGD